MVYNNLLFFSFFLFFWKKLLYHPIDFSISFHNPIDKLMISTKILINYKLMNKLGLG